MVEAIYHPREPKLSPLHQSVQNHFPEFESVYEERYQKRFGVLRDVVREVVYKYLGCGDLKKGFARIKCKSCHHEVLLAFSCKGRYFCPSCHQKRVLMFGEWITQEILYPLPHRQYVFTVPEILRPYFRFDRKLLGKLSQCAYQRLKEFFQKTLNKKDALPGTVIFIQTFGDLINSFGSNVRLVKGLKSTDGPIHLIENRAPVLSPTYARADPLPKRGNFRVPFCPNYPDL